MEQVYAVTGMHCQACVAKLSAALVPLVPDVKVDLASATARVTDSTASLEQLNKAAARAGNYHLSLVEVASPAVPTPAEPGGMARYYPLLLIAFYLAVGSFAGAVDAAGWMRHFMAVFFLVFSFFKLLNLLAFADSYAMYDLVAGRVRAYGFVYPFLELGLGFAYLFAWQMQPVLWFTLALSVLSGIGVARSMLRRQDIRCACLGAVLNVPVSTVTLIEDLGMAAMAAAMLAAK
jgi:copper chaperone CopZ